jgi:chemotaxis protein MotB
LIRIEGHTDNTPLGEGGKFPTNWELSSARAAWITRYLIAKFNFPARRLSAAGYAEGRPIVENTTEENKSKNRRIELVVTNIKDNAPMEQ